MGSRRPGASSFSHFCVRLFPLWESERGALSSLGREFYGENQGEDQEPGLVLCITTVEFWLRSLLTLPRSCWIQVFTFFVMDRHTDQEILRD